MTVTVLSIRVLHVLLGALWVGAVAVTAVFLDPTVREMGPEGGRMMGILQRRGFQRTVLIIAVFTVITGLWLLWHLSGGFSSSFMGSRSGIVLSTGGLLGIIALVIGGHVITPTGKRLGALGARLAAQGTPPGPEDSAEMGRLQRRLTTSLRAVALLVLVTIVLMALGPHL
jgi:uncharacterized membrane protein